ncbi:MAG TPA: hypothetical protein VJI69_05305 [Bacteroidia bacterium]|nr:hypothetical protein [Bacteroidia bacterium]
MIKYFIVLIFFSQTADSNLQTGINYFNARTENAKGLQANAINVDKAIQIFDALLKQNKDVKIAGGYYMQCLNFKGRFVYTDDKDKKKAFAKAIELGNDLVQKFPKDGKIRFELISAIGLLAEINGVMKSVEDWVLNKMLYHTKILTETDSLYNEGGGWKVETALHVKTPYIPFILTWPDKKKGIAIMKNALRHFPTNVGCNFYYAEALYEDNQKSLAKIYFELSLKLPSRKDYRLEDEFFKVKAKKYLSEWN